MRSLLYRGQKEEEEMRKKKKHPQGENVPGTRASGEKRNISFHYYYY